MSARSLLLRVLLSATLILNGGAGVAMPAGHAAGGLTGMIEGQDQPLHAAIDAASRLPCHDDGGRGAADLPVSLIDVADGADPAENGSADNCCGLDACGCGCVHQGGLAFAALLHRVPDTHRAHSLVNCLSDHAAPMLANLMRPPIV